MTAARIQRLRSELRARGLDAMVVSSLPHIRYLTAFTGSRALCIVTARGAHFITDPRYSLQSSREVRGFTRTVTAFGLLEAAAGRNMLSHCRAAAFEPHHLSATHYRQLKRFFPPVKFVDAAGLVEDMVLVKDPSELAAMRRAARISEQTFLQVLQSIRPGVSELEIAAEISYVQKGLGAERDAFDPIVASGVRGSLPHAHPTRRRIRNGDLVTLDFGCTVRGYHSDISRTIAVGRVSRRRRELYSVVLDAQLAAVAVTREGVGASELDNVARERIRAAGYGRYFVHGVGHGLGLRLHERPKLSAQSKERLIAGSVVAIEPGVYLPGYGGVRIEDDLVVTTRGCRALTAAPRELLTV